MFGLLLTLTVSALSYQSLGHIIGICFGRNAVIYALFVYVLILTFDNTSLPTRELPDVLKKFSSITIKKQSFDYMLVLFYGFDRCPENQISSVMYKKHLDDDDFDKSWTLLLIQLIFYRILT